MTIFGYKIYIMNRYIMQHLLVHFRIDYNRRVDWSIWFGVCDEIYLDDSAYTDAPKNISFRINEKMSK